MAEMNIHEAFLMAIEIEKTAREFYQRASTSAASQEFRILFNEIVEDENSHIEIFQKLHKQSEGICGKETHACHNDYVVHLIDLEPFLKNLSNMPSTIEEVMKTSIEAEKNAILYYMEIKNHLPEGEMHADLEKILHEEKMHFVALSELLKTMGGHP